ncbi:MAG: ABC transporter ATP-binding protein, partial [Actinomycetia bacterium]|nr:ABC transporter ATP-binding protein [Actinomycetes bacterium]
MTTYELVNASRTFPTNPPTHALRDVSLTINEGEMVAITGPSGAGKSTLLHLLALLDSPTGGQIIFRGQDISALTENQRCTIRSHQIGMIFQSFHLLSHRDAVSNVALGRLYRPRTETTDDTAADWALSQVSMQHRRLATPKTMSGGEQQRVAIARALVGRPSVLLCDEPTGNLDRANSDAIIELLENLVSTRATPTVIIVTHDPSVAD